MLCRFLVLHFRHSWGLCPRSLGLACGLLVLVLAPSAAPGEGTSETSETHILLGPKAAAALANSEWDSEIGAELHLVRLRPTRAIGLIGAGVGVASFSSGDTLQLSFRIDAGTTALGGIPIGLSAGPMLRAFDTGRPQLGGGVSAWLYNGVAPYITLSWYSGPGAPPKPGLEIGVAVPFSIWDW